jgi:GAF domain-containing protein
MSFIRDSPGFELTTGFEGRSALLALHGRLENLAAMDLWTALERVIDLRDLRNLGEAVVLDLSELEFIGAAGLGKTPLRVRQCQEAGVELSLRTPSHLVHRLLETIGPTELDRLDQALACVGDLGAEQVHAPNSSASSSNSTPTTEDLRRMTATPATPDAVDGVLRLVAELVRVSVRGADGVSVALRRHGTLLTVAATDEAFVTMDTDQCATGEGPSVDASLQGTPFHAESLDTDARWPSFTPRARGLGIMAILALPLHAFEESIGSLTVYARTASILDADAQRTAEAFATQASMILSDAEVGVANTRLALQFKEVLRSRENVASAKGTVMELERSHEDDVFTNLLRQSIKSRAE